MNEDELYKKVLKQYNFSFVVMEELSILEQIKLFVNASIIISPHGSALAYSIFSNKKTHIIEILPYIKNKQHFNQICEVLNISYSLYSNIVVLDDYINMTIDIDKFNTYLIEQLRTIEGV